MSVKFLPDCLLTSVVSDICFRCVQARERRDGSNKDYDEHSELQSTTADYRAVAPDAKLLVAELPPFQWCS